MDKIKILIRWLSEYEIKDRSAIAILIVAVTVFFSPLLFFGKILLNGDATYYAYPVAYFFSHYFGSAINPFLFSGYPIPDAFQAGFFHPLNNFFFYFFDFIFAYHFLVFLDFIGAAIFTYLFVRKLGLSVYASLLAGLAYTFSQYSVAWLGVLSVANAIFLLPAIAYSILQILDLNKKFIVVFGLILGVAFLGTHYHFLVIALMGGMILFMFETWNRWDHGVGILVNLKSFLFLILGIFIALIISLPQALHSLRLFSESTRITLLAYHSAPYIDLIKFLIPTFNIIDVSIEEFRPYIGVVPLFFAVIYLYQVVRRNIKDKRAIFFSLFFIITLVMCLRYSPTLLIMKYLPFLKYFVGQSRWVHLSSFALIILASFGFDYVLKRDSFSTEKVMVILKRIVIGIFAFFTIANLALFFFGNKLIIFTQNYFDKNLYSKTTQQPLQYYHDIIDVLARKSFLNISFLNPNIVLFVVLSIGLYFILKIFERKLLFSNVVILFTIFNMLAVSMATFDLGDKNILLKKSNISEFIKTKETSFYDYRVFGFIVPFAEYQQITAIHPEAEEEAMLFTSEALMGNLNVFSETPIVGGYDPMAFRRYQNIVAFLENTLARKTTEEKISLFLTRLNLLSALNVKYIVSPYVLDSEDLDLVFSEKVTSFNVPLYLYQNKKVIPRFYLAKNVIFLSENDENDNFTKITESSLDFKNDTFIECNKCESDNTDKKGVVVLISNSNDEIELGVTSDRSEWLILTNEAVPGWHSKIDGVLTKIYYANHAFQAVKVPPGHHTVTFSYSIIPYK